MSAPKRTGDTEVIAIREVVVANKVGIHARPAAMFVKIANRFQCEIFVEKDGEKVNGKSIMGLLMLAAGPGSKLQVEAKGADAEPALREIEALFVRKFEEE
jgi:phosphocarrier protein